MPFFIKATHKHSLSLCLTWDCSGSSRRLGLDRADRRPFMSERLWLLSSSSVRSCSSSPPMSSRLGCDCAIWKARRRLETDIHLNSSIPLSPAPLTEIFPKVEVIVLKASPSFPVAAFPLNTGSLTLFLHCLSIFIHYTGRLLVILSP